MTSNALYREQRLCNHTDSIYSAQYNDCLYITTPVQPYTVLIREANLLLVSTVSNSLMKSALLLFHTVRYLKIRQIIGRFWFHLYRPKPRLITNARIRSTENVTGSHSAETQCTGTQSTGTQSTGTQSTETYSTGTHPAETHSSKISETEPKAEGPSAGLPYLPCAQSLFLDNPTDPDVPVLRVLGDELPLGDAHDWNHPAKAKLFLYNVHYFDDLNAWTCDERQPQHITLINRWIAENPAPQGNGWESYPLSLRIVNWVKFFTRQESIERIWLDSLASQAHYLSRRLEYHLLGNHLFTNAKALIFAGCYLEDMDDLLSSALGILEQELPEQVLADGGHFELSPMYHCIAMADLMDLIALAKHYPEQIPDPTRASWEATLVDMFLWLERMRHPDGQISLFNDAAMDIAPDYTALSEHAEGLGLRVPCAQKGLHHAGESGYVTIHNESLSCMLDIGRIGPDYLPGHSHADSLSFELSLFGQRLVCDSGTSVYGAGDERLRQRGTAAHNTVLIDEQNSSEVWSGFRVARRARPFDITLLSSGDEHHITAAHSGYHRLPGKNTHKRIWTISPQSFHIEDTIAGNFTHACAMFHLHPSIDVQLDDEAVVTMQLANGQQVQLRTEGGTASVESSTWHPRFGDTIPSHKVVVVLKNSQLKTTFSWQVR